MEGRREGKTRITTKNMVFDSFLWSEEWEVCIHGPFTAMGICASEIRP